MPRRSRRFRLRARWLALAAIGLIGLLYYQPLRTYLGTRAELRARTAEVRLLRAQKIALERRRTQVESGEELLRQARRIGLVKPSERLFIIKGIESWRRAETARRRSR